MEGQATVRSRDGQMGSEGTQGQWVLGPSERPPEEIHTNLKQPSSQTAGPSQIMGDVDLARAESVESGLILQGKNLQSSGEAKWRHRLDLPTVDRNKAEQQPHQGPAHRGHPIEVPFIEALELPGAPHPTGSPNGSLWIKIKVSTGWYPFGRV